MNTPRYEIEYLDVDLLLPYARNARTHTEEQILLIANSIQKFGWTNPVLIDQADTIVAGHGRVLAARALGIYTVPCLRLEFMDDEMRRAYVLADNQLALRAGWDFSLLRDELFDLKDLGFDIEVIGFDDEELNEILSGAADEKDEPPQEFTLKVWSKDEAMILAVKKLLGVNATAAKVEADVVVGMLRRA